VQPQDATIVGGTVLRIPAIQSPNYVAGVSGWIIEIDGSAEFNNLTIRGQFVGTNFVINTQGAFFYSGVPANGNLIASIAGTAGTDAHSNAYSAGVEVFFPSAPLQITMNPSTGRLEFFGEAAQASAGSAAYIGYQSPGNTSQMLLVSGLVNALCNQARISLISGAAATEAFLQAVQESAAGAPGTAITGTLVQNDDATGSATAKFMHAGTYNVTFAAGAGTLTHGCAFTPTMGLAAGKNTGGTAPGVCQVGTPGASTVALFADQPSGAALPNGTYAINAVFYG
jgi:hypothetical protein